jgi:hypothetical protein
VTQAAIDWAMNFRPSKDDDYAWVYDLAVMRYQRLYEGTKRLDDKAAAIITAIGGSTGIFTLGSLAALGTNTVNPWVVVAALPTIMMAILSVAAAVRVRMGMLSVLTPNIPYAATCVQDLQAEGNPKAAVIGSWHIACEVSLQSHAAKLSRLDQAHRWFLGAMIGLLLPIGVGVLSKIT